MKTQLLSAVVRCSVVALLAAGFGLQATAQVSALPKNPPQQDQPSPSRDPSRETTEDYNRRLQQLQQAIASQGSRSSEEDYRIGAGDLLEIAVFEAAELGRVVRVAASGEISLPLLGVVRTGGLTPRELESVLEELLRRAYLKDPHVSVFVKEMESHPVSVLGAVRKPGVFQIRGEKTLVEMLSMAEGLAADAGDTVLVIHQTATEQGALAAADEHRAHSGPGDPAEANPYASNFAPPDVSPAVAAKSEEAMESEEINLKSLLESGDPRHNVRIHPGDVVKVTRAGVIYVVGEVKKPGGFELRGNENISVLQALALAEGLTRTSARSRARIIRTEEPSGKRKEIPINVDKILAGKTPDPMLQPRDIIFIPNSSGRGALYRGMEAALSIGSSLAVYRP
jgi:polysaccharide export outer membrane protein